MINPGPASFFKQINQIIEKLILLGSAVYLLVAVKVSKSRHNSTTKAQTKNLPYLIVIKCRFLLALQLPALSYQRLPRFVIRTHRSASPALSQARRGPTHPVTVMFYTPRGRAAIRNPWP